MRLTRAALRAEATTQRAHETPDVASHAQPSERVPLSEVSANVEVPEPDDIPCKMPKGKAKGGAKKSARARENKKTEAAEHDASAEGPHSPASLPSRAVRMTRRQLAQQEEQSSRSQRTVSPLQQPAPAADECGEDPACPSNSNLVDGIRSQPSLSPQNAEISITEADQPAATVDSQANNGSFVSISEPEPKLLASEKPYEQQPTPETSRTSTHTPSRSSSKSPVKSPMCIEESIEAIDALEEALENVGKAFSKFDQSGDEKSPKKSEFPGTDGTEHEHETPNMRGNDAKNLPLVRNMSRNPSAVHKSSKSNAARSSIARSTSVRAAPTREARNTSGEPIDYLASKRRPVSVSFPTPPPPQRSTKAPTKAAFQLPGEAVAARLKAQKEERLKHESDGGVQKQRPISLPPPLKSNKAPTKPSFQLPGEAVAAKLKIQKEERLRRETNGTEKLSKPSINMPPLPKSTRPPTKPNFQLPGEVVAAKLKLQREERLRREGETESAKKAPTFRARVAPARKPTAAPVRKTSASRARENLTSNDCSLGVNNSEKCSAPSYHKRNSGNVTVPPLSRTLSTSSASPSNRNSVLLKAGDTGTTKSTVSASDAMAQRLKGREVFNRDKLEKESKDREKRQKEDAAKKARVDAAERGRIASREWAEKQKRKLIKSRKEEEADAETA